METKDNAAELAFAECIRQQALHIATLCMRGKTQEVAEAALSICSQSARHTRELLGQPEPLDVDVDHDETEVPANYDLRDFNAKFGDANE